MHTIIVYSGSNLEGDASEQEILTTLIDNIG